MLKLLQLTRGPPRIGGPLAKCGGGPRYPGGGPPRCRKPPGPGGPLKPLGGGPL